MKDVSTGKIGKDFMKNYEYTKLDVVSLAEAKAVVEATLKEDLKAQLLTVLNHIE